MTKLINKFQRGGQHYYITPQYGMSPETSQTVVYKPVVTDVQKDIQERRPIGTTTANRIIRAKQQEETPVIKSTEIPSETQQEINKVQQTRQILEPINRSLDVVEYIPVIGDGITLGRTANEIKNKNYLPAAMMLAAGLFPAGKKWFKLPESTETKIIEKIKGPKGLFGYIEKNMITPARPAIEATPAVKAVPDQLFDPVSKTYKNIPEGVKKRKGLVYKSGNQEVKKLSDGNYEIEGTIFTPEEIEPPRTFERFIYPDGTLYGDFVKGSFKKGKPGVPEIPGTPAQEAVFDKGRFVTRGYVSPLLWTTGITGAALIGPSIDNKPKKNKETLQTNTIPTNNTSNVTSDDEFDAMIKRYGEYK